MSYRGFATIDVRSARCRLVRLGRRLAARVGGLCAALSALALLGAGLPSIATRALRGTARRGGGTRLRTAAIGTTGRWRLLRRCLWINHLRRRVDQRIAPAASSLRRLLNRHLRLGLRCRRRRRDRRALTRSHEPAGLCLRLDRRLALRRRDGAGGPLEGLLLNTRSPVLPIATRGFS